jgi:predicted acetyltransferase
VFSSIEDAVSLLVSIRDVGNSKPDRRWIQSVYGEYIDSLADLNTGLFSVIGTVNPHQDEIFANWFSNDQSHPLLILHGRDPVGFALVVRQRIPKLQEKPPNYRMSEFFVRQQHRRAGIGRNAATLIFDRFAGEWEILEYLRHPGAVAFWRTVVAGYCGGRYTERSHNGEVQQRFASRLATKRGLDS